MGTNIYGEPTRYDRTPELTPEEAAAYKEHARRAFYGVHGVCPRCGASIWIREQEELTKGRTCWVCQLALLLEVRAYAALRVKGNGGSRRDGGNKRAGDGFYT